MTKLLTQQDWDKLPVHTTAVLTRTLNGVTRTVHVTRAAGDIQLKDDGYLLLGGARWNQLFADSDSARTLFVPAGRAIDVSELTALLRRHPVTTPLAIACGHRRFRPERWAKNTGRTVGDTHVALECSVLDGDGASADVADLLQLVLKGLPPNHNRDLMITRGSLLSVVADGLKWAVTGAEERDGTVLITTDLIVDEPEDPSPRWTSIDEYLRRANETAALRQDKRYRPDASKGRILQDIRATEESLEGLEAAVAATDEQLKCWVADAERRRKDLALARYIVGVTDRLESPEEVLFDA